MTGTECLACSDIEEDGDESAPCEVCGAEGEKQPVTITECPLGPGITTGSPRLCPDEAHHYGRGDHVSNVE